MKILFLAMSLAFFASCNNGANQDAETSDTTMSPGTGDMNTTTPGAGDMSTTPGTDTTRSSGDTSTFEGAANDSIGK